MRIDFYQLLLRLTGAFGPWLLVCVSRCIATGYFLLSRKRQESCRLYRMIYPERSVLYHLWCTFRQYQNFTTIHFDRYLANHGQPTELVTEGRERLEEAIGTSGAILLMSHLGNWEMAARVLMQTKRDIRLLLYMGKKEKEGVERTQKEELRQAGVTIIGVDQESSDPFSVVEGMRVLGEGGLVSMTGDIVWRADQRCLDVSFLGQTAKIPEAPFVFALASGAPIYVFFAFRTGKNRYHVTFSEPLVVKAASRAERRQCIQEAAQGYATILESALRSHPLEWYHFDHFVSTP